MSKVKPTQRLEFFLAKIAGEDIDIATLVPPVATSKLEKILLAIADRIDDGSASAEELDESIEKLEAAVAALEERVSALEGKETPVSNEPI